MSTALTVGQLLERKGSELAARLPKGMESDRFTNSIKAAVASAPQLMDCIRSNPQSFMMQCARAATMGLEVGDVFGHFYLLPFKNNRAQTTDTVGVVGYKGLLELARRHPMVAKVNAHLVYKGDTFVYDRGTDTIEHPWSWEVDRSDANILGAYLMAVLVHPVTGARETVIHMMSRAEIDAVRKRSPGASRSDSPWNTDYAAMCRKSVIRQAMNRGTVPMAAEVMVAMRGDDEVPAQVTATVVEQEPHEEEREIDYNEVPELTEPPKKQRTPRKKAAVEKPDPELAAMRVRLQAAAVEAGMNQAALLSWASADLPSAKLAKTVGDLSLAELETIVPALEAENAQAKRDE